MAKEYRILLGVLLLGIGFFLMSEYWLFILAFSLFYLFQLYRGSVFFQKHWKSPNRHFIQTQKDLFTSKCNWVPSVIFIALGLLFFFLESTLDLQGDTFFMIQSVILLSGIMSFISMFIKKGPSVEVLIKPDRLKILKNQEDILSTYTVTEFSIDTHSLKIEQSKKKTFALDELVISPDQMLLLIKQLEQLKNRSNQELIQRVKGWSTLRSWFKKMGR